jgi:Glycosyl hydrolase family 1
VYLTGHHAILAHAAAVDVYRKQFQSQQGGVIGITLNGNWNEPSPDEDPTVYANNAAAAERSLLWAIGCKYTYIVHAHASYKLLCMCVVSVMSYCTLHTVAYLPYVSALHLLLYCILLITGVSTYTHTMRYTCKLLQADISTLLFGTCIL